MVNPRTSDKINTMYTVALFLAVVTLGSCHCPPNGRHALGKCGSQFVCHHDISGVQLPSECQVSSNFPVTLKVILHDPSVFNESVTNIDMSLIASITSFQAYGLWPQENFAMIAQMYELSELNLAGNQIDHIEGYPFYHLNNLKKVDFSHNRLSNLENVLQMQPSLRTLTLAHNFIESIPSDAFVNVTYLEELDLSYNSISNLNTESFSKLWGLKLLRLAFNHIDRIPDGTFDNVTSLEELDLSNNSISNLNNNSFSGLRNSLKVLKLNNNRIVDLDGAINTLKFLKHLYLRGNQIQNIEMQSLHAIYDLETFDISDNHLDNIASDVLARHWPHFYRHSRCKIILSDNYLTWLPNATSETLINFVRKVDDQNLVQTELDLSNNKITTIERFAFQYVLHLTNLDLSRNKLFNFIVHADDLKHVKYLNLSYNYIRSLNHESFSLMDNLENLDLSFNQLEIVPDSRLLSSNMVRYLNMSANEVADISNLRIKFHPFGGVLDLTNNSLSVISIPPRETLRLMMLILKSNYIVDTSLIELSQQDDLKFLDMSRNYIRELNDSSLHLPFSLEYFDLTNNEIIYIAPSVFKDLINLRTLRLSHNLIEYIEYGAFQSLSSLKDLDLSFNDIAILDSKVFNDLKSLEVLSLRYNRMYDLDYKSWIGHKHVVTVNMDGNSFDCRWLAAAISDFDNGISVVRPATAELLTTGNNVKGISCVQNGPEALKDGLDTDRTLLVLTAKILEAVQEQTKMLKQQIAYQAPILPRLDTSRNDVK